MNRAAIRFILGWILNVEAAMMLLPIVVAVLYGESEGWTFVAAAACCLAIGIPCVVGGLRGNAFHSREGLVIVALSWLVLSIMGAVPFVLSGAIPSPVDALFETVSGFTTTGASILTEVESLPRCILFWRSFTHWIGGMGVLVFILSIVPMSGGSHMHLMKAESPGPSVSKLTPKVQSTAKILYEIYLVLTVVQVVLLLLGKMPLFDALTTTFGTAGTGGFGIKNDSMASYSPYLQNVTTVFMILFGINFNAYFLILMKRAKQLRYAEEVWGYLAIIGVSIAAIAWNIRHLYGTLEETLRHAAFQVATIITTTGYSTTDFDQWARVLPHHLGDPYVHRRLRREYRRRLEGLPGTHPVQDHPAGVPLFPAPPGGPGSAHGGPPSGGRYGALGQCVPGDLCADVYRVGPAGESG